MEVLKPEGKNKRGRERNRVQGVKHPLSTQASHAVPGATQYKPDLVPEDWERSKTKSEGRGKRGRGSGARVPLLAPGPGTLVHLPPESTPPSSAPKSQFLTHSIWCWHRPGIPKHQLGSRGHPSPQTHLLWPLLPRCYIGWGPTPREQSREIKES